jgi:glycosyltransferase involved in cell wall biosynthesis
MRRPIRVLELRSVRGTGGGPDKTILLGAAQHDPDIHVTVCYVRDQRDTIFQLDQWAARLGVEYVEVDERHSFDFGAWSRLAAAIGDRQIDIVHAHDYKTDLMALWACHRTNTIPLATAHGWAGQSSRERFVYYPVDKKLLGRFPKVIAVSSDIKHQLIRHGADPNRIEVILNTIDPAMFRRDPSRRASARLAVGLPVEGFVIGAVGRLERGKRFDLLIDAFAPVAALRADVFLVIAGGGNLRDDLQARIDRLKIANQCRLLGHYTDIAGLHHAFDLLVQSSESEGTPNVVLEAMAMETPLIATDVGGTRELARDGVHALVIPKHDLRALQRAIEAVLRDQPAAAARAAVARRRVETELSFATRTRRLEAIYRQLAGDRGHGGV